MKMSFNKKQIHNIVYIVFGNFMIACAVSFFILPNNILTGGVAGVSVALHPLIPLNSVVIINILTISLYVIGVVTLGKEFAFKTIISTIVSPICITGLSMLVKLLPQDYFVMESIVASIYAGVCMGIGLGIVFRANASTGGMDIPALLMTKYFKIRSGNAVMVVDGLTVLLGILTYGLVPALIGIISVFVCGKVINYVVKVKTEPALEVQIISESYSAILEYILETIDRGATVMDAFGAYSKQKRIIIMCVICQNQYPELELKIYEIDPHAFCIVKDVNRVMGKGFII